MSLWQVPDSRGGVTETGGYFCLNFGSPDECQNCGGSATLGGTQHPWVDEHGTRFCSDDCLEEHAEFVARDKERREMDWCPSCGFDNQEHAEGCKQTSVPT